MYYLLVGSSWPFLEGRRYAWALELEAPVMKWSI